MVRTEPVSFEVAKNHSTDSIHLGLITLDTDETTERDFHQMLPVSAGIMHYTSRVKTVNPVSIENLRKMGPKLGHAASLILPDLPLRAVAYSCTSGTLALGYDEVSAQIRSGLPSASRDHVEIVTPLTSAINALHTLEINKISMLTPYVESVNDPMVAFFEDNGIEVVKLRSLFVHSDVDIARVSTESIIQGALEVNAAETQAIFLSCTALRAADTIAALEKTLGIPVLSSNQCMFWQLMRCSGYRRSITGFGRLLEECL